MSRNLLPVAGLDQLVEELGQDPRLSGKVVYKAHLPAQEARYGELDPPPPAPLQAALERGGVPRLWSHQAEALRAVRRRQDVLITTPTASGKSLVFQLPALTEAAARGPGRGLFLFPLKALGQDQRGKFQQLAADAGLDVEQAGCEIYDGDTPPARRAAIRRDLPRVLISNPDMLHAGILGHWTLWGPLLADLSWIVLDELHTYRGIFGSHFHHVLQRLLRLSRSVGGDPVLIGSSATAANAGQFARDLAGRDFHWISESGAPREGRHLLLIRPDTSPYTTALRLFVLCLAAGLKTIVFTKARRITELLYSWLRRQEPHLASRVASYRAGFLPEERRRVEQSLWSGALDGVISTSALEMGIDVGGLDACILVGYPGSMMATWQRSGRVGRNGRESITAMVAMPDALDQYFLDHPEQFLERPCERLVVDAHNRPVARSHLLCAAAELPLHPTVDAQYLAGHQESLAGLLRQGHLMQAAEEPAAALEPPAAPPSDTEAAGIVAEVALDADSEPDGSRDASSSSARPSEPGAAQLPASPSAAPLRGGEIYCLRRHPQRLVHLRGTGNTFAILEARGRTIGTVDGVRALHECHPGAVYLHAGRQYLVHALEREERRARVTAEELDYFTTPLTEKQTEILEVLESQQSETLGASLGRLKVTEWVVGFERKRVHGQETIDQTPLELPPVEFETVGLWWQAPRHFEETLRRAGEHFLGSLHASEHATISLFPLLALCDRGDIGGISYPFHPQVGCGAVFVYDGHPGGVGITTRGYEDLAGLLERVLDLISGCPCATGCPSCIQSPKCGNGNRPLDKPGAQRILRLVLGREAAVVAPIAPTPVAEGFGDWADEVSPRPAGLLAEDTEVAAVAGPVRESAADADPSPAADPPAAALTSLPSTPAAAVDEEGSRRARLPEARQRADPSPLANSLSPEQARRHLAEPLTVLFDVETLRSAADVGGFGNCHRMGLAIGVACFLEEGRFVTYGEKEVHDLVAALRQATLVVGFNIKRFDYGVLAGYTGEDYRRTLPTFDLLEDLHHRLGFRVGLGRLAGDTLGAAKSADGLQSLEWVRQGRLDLVEEYCRHDVEILRDLYLYGRREGCLVYHDTRRELLLKVGVEW